MPTYQKQGPAPEKSAEAALAELLGNSPEPVKTVRTLLQRMSELTTEDDADRYWAYAVDLINGNGNARDLLWDGLKLHPRDPRLLIASGYLWAREGDFSRAIQDATDAVAAAKNQEKFREQYFLANANLCYYLARRCNPLDKVAALEAGKLASDHADEFKHRNSFRINYGYARMRFEKNAPELVQCVAFLAGLYLCRLGAEERAEIRSYIDLALDKLAALNGAANA